MARLREKLRSALLPGVDVTLTQPMTATDGLIRRWVALSQSTRLLRRHGKPSIGQRPVGSLAGPCECESASLATCRWLDSDLTCHFMALTCDAIEHANQSTGSAASAFRYAFSVAAEKDSVGSLGTGARSARMRRPASSGGPWIPWIQGHVAFQLCWAKDHG